MNNNIIDILNRQDFVDNIFNEIEYIAENKGNSFIMIDGEWGIGKTFVLNMIKNKMKNTYADDYNLIEYNCWENSFYPDPLIAIISATTEQLNNYSDINKIGIELMNRFGYFQNAIVGTIENFTNLKLAINIDEPNSKYKSLESYVKEFKQKLINFNEDNLGKDNKRTRVIIVDELDRCLPEYAIKVLERLYLLFKDVPSTIVLIGNNNNQLQHSIKNIFGDIDPKNYLNKIIDKTRVLGHGDVNSAEVYKKYNNFFDLFDLDNAEDLNECINLISFMLSLVNSRERDKRVGLMIQYHKTIFDEKKSIGFCVYEVICTFINKNIMGNLIEYELIDPNVRKEEEINIYSSLISNVKKLKDDNYGLGDIQLNSISQGLLLYVNSFYDMFNGNTQSIYNNCRVKFDNDDLLEKLKLYNSEISKNI